MLPRTGKVLNQWSEGIVVIHGWNSEQVFDGAEHANRRIEVVIEDWGGVSRGVTPRKFADHERDADLARWSSFLTGDLHPAFFPVFMPHRYTTATDKEALEHVKAAGILLVKRKLALIDRHLEGREYFMGARRTYVDAYSVPMIRWARSVLPGGLAAYPDIARHHDHLLQDRGVQRAMTEQGILHR